MQLRNHLVAMFPIRESEHEKHKHHNRNKTKRAKDIKRIHIRGNSNSNKFRKNGSTSLIIKEKQITVKKEALGLLDWPFSNF